MWSKRGLDYDSGACCFKEVKTTAKILIILAFSTRNISEYESIDKSDMHRSGLLPLTFEGLEQGYRGINSQNAGRGKPCPGQHNFPNCSPTFTKRICSFPKHTLSFQR